MSEIQLYLPKKVILSCIIVSFAIYYVVFAEMTQSICFEASNITLLLLLYSECQTQRRQRLKPSAVPTLLWVQSVQFVVFLQRRSRIYTIVLPENKQEYISVSIPFMFMKRSISYPYSRAPTFHCLLYFVKQALLIQAVVLIISFLLKFHRAAWNVMLFPQRYRASPVNVIISLTG